MVLAISQRPHLRETDLQTLLIHVRTARGGYLPMTLNRAIHAQILNWFEVGSPAVAEAIHQSQVSPMSLSGLLGERRGTEVNEGDHFSIRVSLLDGSLLSLLLQGLEQQTNQLFCLSNFPFVLAGIEMVADEEWVGTSSYRRLAQTTRTIDPLWLQFVSPTSFRVKGSKQMQVNPIPAAVFGNLERRWNTFAPEDYRVPYIVWDGLMVGQSLRTRTVKLKKADQVGTVGWAKYHFPDPEQARWATVLARFACFAGVGRKTAMGMGQARLVMGESDLAMG